MALRDQPYLPLYVQDFLTDEKLVECSASATGVYIRLMCIMHKSENYGKILLKQKHKQTDKQTKNFALMIAKQMPYSVDIIYDALQELLDEKVLHIEDEFLVQQRMVKDWEISNKRASAGHSGGKKTQTKTKDFASQFAKAKVKANTENEYEYEIVNEIKDVVVKEKAQRKKFVIPSVEDVQAFANENMIGSKDLPERFVNYYEANGWMINRNHMKNWKAAFKNWVTNEKKYETNQRTNGKQFATETPAERKERQYRDFGKSINGGNELPDFFRLTNFD